MLPLPPTTVAAAFVILVAAMLALLLAGLRRAAGRAGLTPEAATRLTWVVGLALLGWLALVEVLAVRGLFLDLAARPPRLPLGLLAATLAGVALVGSAPAGRLLDAAPATWTVLPQAFRMVVELFLWRLAAAGALPRLVTFEGRNFDVVIGVTAPLVAWMLSRGAGGGRRRLARAWNVGGLLALASVVLHFQLAAFGLIAADPRPVLVATFPWIWLPTFLVPLAVFLHVASLRQLARRG